VAATDPGKRFVTSIGGLTGADVAASTGPTGAAALGGNWDLEFKTGPIESSEAVTAGAQAAWDALLPMPATTPFMLSGSYVGNKVDNRAITGLGFQPDVVIVKAATAGQIAVIRTASMVGDLSKVMAGGTAATSNQIQSLDADGFTIGTGNTVNNNGVTYAWMAFKASTDYLQYGSYSGNGTAGRTITGLGFSPEVAFVFDAGNTAGVFMSAAEASCYRFNGGSAIGNCITSLNADGFTVGNDTQVNGSGRTYHYVAWNAAPGYLSLGTYTGNAVDDRNISGLAFQPEWLMIKSSDAGSQVPVFHVDAQGASTDSSLYFAGTTAGTNRIQALQADGFQVGTNYTVNRNATSYSYIAWAQETAPTISDIVDQATNEDTPTAAIPFTVGDTETVAALLLEATSSNQALLPDGNIVLGGSEANRTITLTPAANANGSVTVTVRVTDGMATSTDTFVLTVNAVNDAPVLSGSNDLASIDEDPVTNNGTLVSDLIAGKVSDADSGVQSGIAVTGVVDSNGSWQYSTNGGTSWTAFGSPTETAARLLAAEADTRVRFVPNANWNGTVAAGITFRAWDLTSGTSGGAADVTGNGGTTAFSSATASASITVNPVNDTPVVDDQAFSVNENSANGTVVGSVVASDVDAGDHLTYSITASNTDGAFAVDPDTGQIVVANNAVLDYETTPVFHLTVQVEDSGALTDTAIVTINLNNVNEAPVVNDQGFSVDENAANGTVVGAVTASDVDSGDSLTYSITSGNIGGGFAIDARTGQITVANSAALDYESNPVLNLIVQLEDSGALTDTAAVTINLNNVNEAPVVSDQAFAVEENSANGTVVGTVVASDVDAGDHLTYSIIGGNTGGAFAIDPSTGEITVSIASMLDYETTPTYVLTVQVQDSEGLRETAAVTVRLNDVEEKPDAAPDSATTAAPQVEVVPAVGSETLPAAKVVKDVPERKTVGLSGSTESAFEPNATVSALSASFVTRRVQGSAGGHPSVVSAASHEASLAGEASAEGAQDKPTPQPASPESNLNNPDVPSAEAKSAPRAVETQDDAAASVTDGEEDASIGARDTDPPRESLLSSWYPILGLRLDTFEQNMNGLLAADVWRPAVTAGVVSGVGAVLSGSYVVTSLRRGYASSCEGLNESLWQSADPTSALEAWERNPARRRGDRKFAGRRRAW